MLYDLELRRSIKQQVFSMLTWKKSCRFITGVKALPLLLLAQLYPRQLREPRYPEEQRNGIFYNIQRLHLKCRKTDIPKTGNCSSVLTPFILGKQEQLVPTDSISNHFMSGACCILWRHRESKTHKAITQTGQKVPASVGDAEEVSAIWRYTVVTKSN